jgi:hypothetical protein
VADDDLNRLAADLSRAPDEAWPFVAKAVEVSARHVKDDWNENLGGKSSDSYFEHIGRSVDYTVAAAGASLVRTALGQAGGTGIQAEIGPNLGRLQGGFAGWFEEGMRNIPALHPGHDALKKNEGDFVDGLAKAVDDGLRKAGLL